MKQSKPRTGSGKKTATRAAAKPATSDSPMDVTLLQQIVQLMSANDLNTVDLRDGERRVVLKRGTPVAPIAPGMGAGYAPPAQYVQPAAAPASPAAAAGAGTTPAGTTPAAGEDEANLIPIKSPMVGTFYARPSPDAKPFVGVGSQVEEDTDVCIIEAMKVFNNIKAECRGTIVKVLVEDRATVEFGQVLFLVKP